MTAFYEGIHICILTKKNINYSIYCYSRRLITQKFNYSTNLKTNNSKSKRLSKCNINTLKNVTL